MSISSLDSSSLISGVASALNECDVAFEPGFEVLLPLRQEFALILEDDRGDAEFEGSER